MVNRGCRQVLMASLVTWQGCRTQAAAKQLVSGCSGASTAGGTGPGGVLRVQEGCAVVSELWEVVLDGAEQGMRPSSMMTWQAAWTRGAKRGRAGQAGGDRVVWGGFWVIVVVGGAVWAVSSNVRRVQRNASVWPRVTAFPGLSMVSVCRLWHGGESPGCWAPSVC
jgi:hypothetical protein